jgi:hypothetical protein
MHRDPDATPDAGGRRGALALLVVFVLVIGGSLALLWRQGPPAATPTAPGSARLVTLRLEGPAARDDAELSSLTRDGERVILLPQYPMRFAAEGHLGALFVLDETDVDAAIGGARGALRPRPLWLDGDVSAYRAGFEGFEAIALDGDDVWLTVEAKGEARMRSLVLHGRIDRDANTIRLDAEPFAVWDGQTPIGNAGPEGAFVDREHRLVVLDEANGAQVAPHAQVRVVGLEPGAQQTAPMATLEYRVTDATTLGEDGLVWALNYLWPGSAAKYRPAPDAVAAAYPPPADHRAAEHVERVVPLRWDGASLKVAADVAPLWLPLVPDRPRNWEGIARFGSGFLVATDQHPSTQLAWIEAPSPAGATPTPAAHGEPR